MFWSRFPFVRILLPFLTGITFALYFNYNRLIPFYFFIFPFGIFASIVFVLYKKTSYRYRWFAGYLIVLLLFCSGYELTVFKSSKNDINYFGRFCSKKNVYLCRLTEPLQVKTNSCKALVEIFSVRDSALWHQTTGKAIIYFEKDSNSVNLNYGDNILLIEKLDTLQSPLNQGEYDYRSYLKNRSVEFSTFTQKNKWKKVSADNGNFILKYAYNFRQKLLTILEKCGLSAGEYSVISAVLIGYRENMDPKIIKEYQGSGAIHILCVAGLHVGVIYMFLNFFLIFFDRFKYGRILKAIILILFIWCYAILTGMSPSVLRATVMFSFISLGKSLKYPPNTINTLAASAFVMLLYNPLLLMEVGFQLSYLAVFGIVIIFPYINRWFTCRYWLFNKVWSFCAVSISAQIATTPLCLYYFHQFPNYFILTNIIVVPLSFLVIYCGIAYLVFYSVPVLSIILSKALTWLLLAMNGTISFIGTLPCSVTKAISISAFEVILLYLLVIYVISFLLLKKPKLLITSLVVALIFMCSFTWNNFRSQHQKKIIVYNVNKHTAIDFVDGKSCYFVTDSSLSNDADNLEYFISTNRTLNRYHVKNTFLINKCSEKLHDLNLYMNKDFFNFAGKSFAIINKNTTSYHRIPVDFLLLSGNPVISLDSLLLSYKPSLLIFDASNSSFMRKKWIEQCKFLNIPYYVTAESGALVYDVKG